LLLGSRGDPALVGPDGEDAYVEAELDLPGGLLDEEGFESLAELRPEAEEGLVLARRVFSDGRTRAYAWGRAAARDDVAAVAERAISPLESLALELRRAGDELRDVELRLRETATELRSFLASLDGEPDRLEQIEAELDRIAEAKRRFRCSSYDELLARAAE